MPTLVLHALVSGESTGARFGRLPRLGLTYRTSRRWLTPTYELYHGKKMSIITVNRLLGLHPSHTDRDESFLQVCFDPNREININPQASDATSTRNFEGVPAHIGCQWRRKAEIAQLSTPRV